jgi:N-acetyl-gamma-glutamyl-phosphate reductase
MGYRAVVLGASGFAGGELLRLLSRHPGIEVVAAAASTRTGRPVEELYPWLADRRMVFVAVDEALAADADMVFSSLPHGESMRLFGAAPGSGPGKLVVDLAGDFRLRDPEARAAWYDASPVQADLGWVYGLTEWHRDEIAASNRVADPGCYAAAALLCLAPLVAAGAVRPDPIHIDGLSGVSGAGRAGGAHGEQFGYASANENLRPYAPTGHRHIGEIEQELGALAGTEVTVSFVPHLVPMTRGLAVTCTAQAEAGATTADLSAILAERYRDEAFVRALDGGRLPESRRVAGTNVAEVAAQVDERTGRALVFGAIDNLGKGAAGQAVQNANLMLGFGEDTALDVAALVP